MYYICCYMRWDALSLQLPVSYIPLAELKRLVIVVRKVVAVAGTRFGSERDRRNAMNFPCAKSKARTSLASVTQREKEAGAGREPNINFSHSRRETR